MFKNFIDRYMFYLTLGDKRLTQGKSSDVDIESPSNGGYQEWEAFRFGTTEMFYLKNNRRDRLLDRSTDGRVYTHEESAIPPERENKHQLWVVEQTFAGSKLVRLKSYLDGKYLSADANSNLKMMDKDASGYSQEWVVDMSRLSFNAGEGVVSLDHMSKPTITYDVVYTQTVDNDSSIPQPSTFSKSVNQSSTFTWSLTETLGISLTISAEGSLPGIAKATASATVSLDVSSTQEVSKSQTISYDFQQQFQLAALSRGYMQCVLGDDKNLTLTGRIKFPLAASYNGNPRSGAQLVKILEALVVNGGRFEVGAAGVSFELPCQVKTGYAMSAKVNIKAIATDIVLQPNSGKEGDEIDLTGTGVGAASSVVFYYDLPHQPGYSVQAVFVSTTDPNMIRVTVPVIPQDANNVRVTVFNDEVESDPETFYYSFALQPDYA